MTGPPTPRPELQRARLRHLARTHFDVELEPDAITDLPFGAAGTANGRAWAVVTPVDAAGIGGLLLWGSRRAPGGGDVLVEHHAGAVARWLDSLGPTWSVWSFDEDGARPAEPEPVPPESVRPSADALDDVLRGAGLEVVCEHGTVRGLYAGLEVARLEMEGERTVLRVGVGRFDRDAAALLHPERDPVDALADVIAQVERVRRAGAPPHPLNLMERSRWLRAEQCAEDPALVPVEPVAARPGIGQDGPAAAYRADRGGHLVVCTTGSDLAVLAETVDLVQRHRPATAELLVPVGASRAVVELTADLVHTVTLRPVAPPWET